MIDKQTLYDKIDELNELTMGYETMAVPLFEEDYLKEFYDFYEVNGRDQKLNESVLDFRGTLEEVSIYGAAEPIAGKTEALFGKPSRIMVFDDPSKLTEELSGYNDGVVGFYTVFDLMFCEYENFTLCFICGSNN